jgi:hypothetical protein
VALGCGASTYIGVEQEILPVEVAEDVQDEFDGQRTKVAQVGLHRSAQVLCGECVVSREWSQWDKY